MKRIKWPSIRDRRKRAQAANSSWETKSSQGEHLRNVLNWMSGYDSAMRDARRALNGEAK